MMKNINKNIIYIINMMMYIIRHITKYHKYVFRLEEEGLELEKNVKFVAPKQIPWYMICFMIFYDVSVMCMIHFMMCIIIFVMCIVICHHIYDVFQVSWWIGVERRRKTTWIKTTQRFDEISRFSCHWNWCCMLFYDPFYDILWSTYDAIWCFVMLYDVMCFRLIFVVKKRRVWSRLF